MLFLLPRRLRKRISVWSQFVLCVIVLHAIALWWLLILYRADVVQHRLSLDVRPFDTSMPIIVMPLLKTTGTQQIRTAHPASAPTPVAEKVPVPPPTPAPVTEPGKKNADTASVAAPPVPSKKVVKEAPKKSAVVQPAPKKDEQSKKAPVQQKASSATKEHKSAAPSAKVPSVTPAGTETAPVVVPQRTPDSGEYVDQNAVYLGREDMHALQLHEEVYETIRTGWRPPPGFAAKVNAEVTVMVGWDGTVQQCTVTRSSGVPLFDASIRRDIKKITFPRGAWGKKWLLTLNNEIKGS